MLMPHGVFNGKENPMKSALIIVGIFMMGVLAGSAITTDYIHHHKETLSCHITFSDGMRTKHVFIGKLSEANNE